MPNAGTVGRARDLIFTDKRFWSLALILPAAAMTVSLFVEVSANPLEELLDMSGNTALFLYLATLYISPAQKITPKSWRVALLKRRRRMIGVACFLYACLHLTFYLLDHLDAQILRDNLSKPFILIGLTAFTVLLVLAITSNDFSVRRLTPALWKKIHLSTFALIPLITLHLVAEERGNYSKPLLMFTPFLLITGYLFFRRRLKR